METALIVAGVVMAIVGWSYAMLVGNLHAKIEAKEVPIAKNSRYFSISFWLSIIAQISAIGLAFIAGTMAGAQ